MLFPCLAHNELTIKVDEETYKYCRKCRKLWHLGDVLYTVKNPNHSHLRGFKSWKEIKEKQKKLDFEHFLKSIGRL